MLDDVGFVSRENLTGQNLLSEPPNDLSSRKNSFINSVLI